MAGSRIPSPRPPLDLSRAQDLTRPLGRGMALPGDPELAIEPAAGLAETGYRLTRLAFGSHAGTHLDAPAHVLAGGATLESLEPACFLKPGRVVPLPDPACLDAEGVARLAPVPGEALLFKTTLGRLPRPAYRPAGAPLVTPAGARALAAAGAGLVGIDYPSIEPLEGDLAAHRILLGAGILLLEELDLERSAPGAGWLLFLPLAWPGADGAPTRALWVPEGSAARAGQAAP